MSHWQKWWQKKTPKQCLLWVALISLTVISSFHVGTLSMSAHRQCQDVGFHRVMWHKSRRWVTVRLIEAQMRKWHRPEVDRHLPYFRSFRSHVVSCTWPRTWTTCTHKLLRARAQSSTARQAKMPWLCIIIFTIISSNSSIRTCDYVMQQPTHHCRLRFVIRSNWCGRTITTIIIILTWTQC